MGVENVTGKIALLRAHDRGSKFGPPSDQIDVEVVVQFVGRPNEAFGFQLRDDAQGPAREGMLGLLRDGFNHGWTVGVDYDRNTAAGRRNGIAFRVFLIRPAGQVGGGGLVVAPSAGGPAEPRARAPFAKRAKSAKSGAKSAPKAGRPAGKGRAPAAKPAAGPRSAAAGKKLAAKRG